MKRYNVVTVVTPEGAFSTAPLLDPEGEWVRYSDVEEYADTIVKMVATVSKLVDAIEA